MEELSDEKIRESWREHGGDFHGPNVETATMPEAQLFAFVRGLIRMGKEAAWAVTGRPMNWQCTGCGHINDGEVRICAKCKRERRI